MCVIIVIMISIIQRRIGSGNEEDDGHDRLHTLIAHDEKSNIACMQICNNNNNNNNNNNKIVKYDKKKYCQKKKGNIGILLLLVLLQRNAFSFFDNVFISRILIK
jgi:hypothetical protein